MPPKAKSVKRRKTPGYQPDGFTLLCITVTTVVAMIAYSSFPLAIVLNHRYFWNGLVSTLTEPNQPYNWLFTAGDVAASLFGITFFGYLCWREEWDRLQAIALGLVVLACFAELLTDLYTLPANFVTTDGIPSAHYLLSHPTVLTHGIASFVNSAAFVISFGLWVLHRRRVKKGKLHREAVLALVLLVASLGSLIGYLFPASSPTLQRMFILCYCYWFVALPFDSLRLKQKKQIARA